MSDHDVDDSGTNRTWLSVVLIAVVIGIAAAATKAAPHAADARGLDRTGVLVVKDGTVHDGTLLVRAGAITLIQKRREQLFPRPQVLLFEEDFDRVARSEGVLVLENGRVVRGHLLVRDGELWLLQGNHAHAHARSDVRYFNVENSELGVAYYAEFPRKAYKTLDERTDRAPKPEPAPKAPDAPPLKEPAPPSPKLDRSQKNWIKAAKNPKVARALLHNSGGEWGKASDLWLELYAERRWKPFLQNYTSCASKWIEEKVLRRFHRKELLRRINWVLSNAREKGLLENPQFRVPISKTLELVIRESNRSGYGKTAHEVVTIMSSLGEDYETKAHELWESLPPSRFNLEGGR